MPIRSDATARPMGDTALPGAASPQRPVRSAVPSAPSGRPAAHPAPRRPDPTSTRLAVAAGGIAIASALLAAIGSAAVPAGTAAAVPTTGSTAVLGPVQTIVKYVYVQPGQAAPPATVAAVVATPRPRPLPAPVVTSQSGAKP